MSQCNTVHRKTTDRAAMVRRGGTVQAWVWAWSEIRQDINAIEMIQALDRDREGEEQNPMQIGDSESDDDDLLSSQAVLEVMASFHTRPVIGESFCQCYQEERQSTGFSLVTDCLCGEEDQSFEWVWDEQSKSSGALLSCGNRKVNFHSDYSCGTAAIRGTKELADGQHFWEVKMTSPVYGTDMMVGIGTSAVNLEKFKHNFGSLLGHDEESWGLSYTGHLQHKGDKVKFSSEFGLGSIIGLHLDTWHGTLTIYKNRHCIGVAATGLQSNKFYPMVCSTAAKSSMKVIRACCTPTSLQYLCCARLRQMLPCCPDILSALELPVGLRTLLHPHLGWVFTLSGSPQVSEHHQDLPEDFQEETDLPLSPSPIPSLESTWSACDCPSPCTSPFPDTASYQCPCQTSNHIHTPCTCPCPPTPPSSDNDSCCSEPEDYRCKRCRWT